MTTAVLDYGAGNIGSVLNALWMAGSDPVVAQTPEDVLAADRLVVPGVGAAGPALAKIRAAGLDETLSEFAVRRARPVFGICLGMQILARALREYGEHAGLGWIDGEVVDLADLLSGDRRIPHMGWNKVDAVDGKDDDFARHINGKAFYFAHSYTMRPRDPSVVAGWSDYGEMLVAAVHWQTVYATQFHPEKSQASGQKLLEGFLDWNP